MQGFRSFHSAWRTIQGIEAVNMIRKGQIRWLPKSDILRQAAFISELLAVAIAPDACISPASCFGQLRVCNTPWFSDARPSINYDRQPGCVRA